MSTYKKKSKTIAALPDLCLLTIFDRVPLMDVLSNVSLTSPRWHSLRHSILSRRTRLHLKLGTRLGRDHSGQEDVDELYWPVLTPERVHRLSTLLANAQIRSLSLRNFRADSSQLMSMASFSTLLHQFASSTTTRKPLHTLSLDLVCKHLVPIFSDQLLRSVQALAGSSSDLRVLHLDYGLLNSSGLIRARKPFPLLSQLDRLETDPKGGKCLVEFCHWLGANNDKFNGRNNNTRLQIVLPLVEVLGSTSSSQTNDSEHRPSPTTREMEQIYRSGAPLDQFTGSFPQACDGVESVQLGIQHPELAFEHFRRFAARFSRLAWLDCSNTWLEIGPFTQALGQLRGLTVLKLSVVSFGYNLNSVFHQADPDTSRPFVPLASVRQLTLAFQLMLTGTSADYGEQLGPDDPRVTWFSRVWHRYPHADIFPGLRELCIEHHQQHRQLLQQQQQPNPFQGALRLSQTIAAYKQWFNPSVVERISELIVQPFQARCEHLVKLGYSIRAN